MKPLVIYHAHCTDGFGAAFCAWLKFGDEAEYLPMQYGEAKLHEALPFTPLNREVYILDFSFERQIMEFIFKDAKRVVWLDHHKTAFEMWCTTEREKHVELHPLPNDHIIVLDNSKSGAMLAWEYFNPGEEAPLFIKLIDDRDRWQFLESGSKAFHTAMTMRKPWSFESWKHEFVGPQGYFYDIRELLSQGELLLKYQEQQVQSLAKYARKCFIMIPNLGYGVTGFAVNTSVHMSEVGHALANKSESFGMIWYLGENGEAKVSLRSNGDYDVSLIAKRFGGGGHKNAAGFSVPIATLLCWLK